LSTYTQVKLRHLRFRFELTWLRNPVFIEKLKENWGDNVMLNQHVIGFRKNLKSSNSILRDENLTDKGLRRKKDGSSG
jgi:hypothetical protein